MKKKEFIEKISKLKEEKMKILDSIFITKEEAERIKDFQSKSKEVTLILRCAELSAKNDKVVEILGNILRKNDPKGENKVLQKVFTEFYRLLDEFESKEHLEDLHELIHQERHLNQPPNPKKAKETYDEFKEELESLSTKKR